MPLVRLARRSVMAARSELVLKGAMLANACPEIPAPFGAVLC
jgi:hypothetical protein